MVREVVPFTVDDINASINSKNKKLTFGEALSNKYTSAQYATEADAEKASKEGKLKAGDKVTIGGVSGTWTE